MGALDCKAWVKEDKEGKKKVINGKGQKFRCFATSMEAAFPTVYNQRKFNTDLIHKTKKLKDQVDLISRSIPKDAEMIRVHIGGDFYNQTYFDAWMEVAGKHPDIWFYSYTKSLPFWVARLDNIPSNYQLTASYGGRFDKEIGLRGLKFAKVVGSDQEAVDLGLEIDYTDEHAALPKYADTSFALALHNHMTKGTWGDKMMKVQKLLKKKGKQNV